MNGWLGLAVWDVQMYRGDKMIKAGILRLPVEGKGKGGLTHNHGLSARLADYQKPPFRYPHNFHD